jgi:putative membrane protein insertion efficiency factor
VLVIALARHRPHFAGQDVVAKVLIFFIRIYQKTLSRLLGNVCRFEPSCSRYAVACLENHGAVRGSLLSVVRLCKCHPFHPGGIDLPPPKKMSL